MVVYTDKHVTILVGKETTWGTAVSPTKDLGLVQKITPKEDNTLLEAYALAQRNPAEITAGGYKLTVDIDCLFQHGRLLEYAFGAVSTADSTTDAEHTFTEADTLPSFTLEDGFNSTTDIVLTYAGLKVNTLEISLDIDGQLSMSANCIGKTVATTTSATSAVVSTLATYPDFMATVKTGTAGSEATLNNVQNFKFNLNNNLVPLDALTHRLVQDLQATKRSYRVSFSYVFDSKVDYELFLGSSAPADTSSPTIPSIVIDVTNGVALDSGKRQFYIKLTDCKYNSVTTSSELGGYVKMDFEAWATSLNTCTTTDNIKDASW